MSRFTHKLALATRRAVTGGAAMALAVGLATVPTATAQPLQTEEGTVSDASMIWGVNGYAQQGVFAAWRFFDAEGDAEIIHGNTRGGTGTQTEYTPAAYPATSMPGGPDGDATPNAAKFTGGEGTRDSNGVLNVEWEGEFTVNAYVESFNAPDETFIDPRLIVNPDGSGSLFFDIFFAAAEDMQGNPIPEVNMPDTELLTFSPGGVDVAEDGTITLNADYENVEYEHNPAEDMAQNRTCEAPNVWGAFPSDFIDALNYSVRAHYYTTSCSGIQNNKGPLPVQLDYEFTAGELPGDGGGDDDDNGGGDGGGDNGGGDGGGNNGGGIFGSLGNIFSS